MSIDDVAMCIGADKNLILEQVAMNRLMFHYVNGVMLISEKEFNDWISLESGLPPSLLC